MGRWRGLGLRCNVVAQPIARQGQRVDRSDYLVGVEPGIGIGGVGVVDGKGQIFRHAFGEIGLGAVRKLQVFAALILLGVMLHDEAACAAHHVEAHQIAPIIGIAAFLEGGERTYRALVAADELMLAAEFCQQLFWTHTDVDVFTQEQGQLRREVEIGLVVGRGRQQNALAVVALDVTANHLPAFALLVAQVMRFVDQHDAVAPGLLG